MPTKTEKPKDNVGRWIQQAIDVLRGGRPGVDPVEADWSLPYDPDHFTPSFAYYNFRLERFEYGRGRIPRERLWEYEPSARTPGEETPPRAP
jgi:hypothetical protein